eukprot:jgi/Orpsp1_1/1189358/evm.model.d7180000071383.1
MKNSNIITVLFSVLGVVNSYNIQCNTYYNVNMNEDCFAIANKNEISISYLNTLNPDIDCNNLQAGTLLCLNGDTDISKDGTCGEGKGSCPYNQCCGPDGTCGTTEYHCGIKCNPNYGICNDGIVKVNTVDEAVANIAPLDYDNEKITDISKILSIDNTEAQKLYESANEGLSFYEDAFIISVQNNLSVDECKIICEQANEKFNSFVKDDTNDFNITTYNSYLQAIGEELINSENLLDKCINKCFIIREVNENYEYITEEENDQPLEKRALQSCENPSLGNIEIVQSKYKYDFNIYRERKGSAETALRYADGCSIPVIQKIYNQNRDGIFVPACNSHDICYGCQGGKSICDKRFLDNMKEICKKWMNNNSFCLGEADVFYAIVSIAGRKSYDNYGNNEIRKNCAFCGTPLIQDTLMVHPFFV